MHVALDIRSIRDFGAGTYTRNLVRTLARLDAHNRYFLVGSDSDAGMLGDLPDNFQLLHFPRSQDGLLHDIHLTWKLRKERVAVWHTPYLAVPWTVPCCHITTVHDTVGFLGVTPDGASLREVLFFQRTRRALHRAVRILSVSFTTRRDLIRLFGLPPEKIEVIYNAVDPLLDTRPSPEDVRQTLARYSVHDPYLLYAGNVKPHKNLPRLIEAFALLKDDLRGHPTYDRLKLIIIGDELSHNPQLRRAVVQSRTESDVRFLGFVPPQTLSVFYAWAAAFVFPSLYEGFGLPPLEAMAHGTPVLASNVPALVEVLGEAALFVGPENLFEISRGMRRILLDEGLRKQLEVRGRAQAGKFSWEDSVGRVIELYQQSAAHDALHW